MGLISKAALLATGYVLGARAGTARYQQILQAAQTLAARPELQPYLGELARRLPQAPPTVPAANPTPDSTPTGTPTGTATPTAAADPLPGATASPPATLPNVTGPGSSKGTRLRRRATS